MVLIKYLEDRNVFPSESWFGKFHKGAKSFFEVLKSGDPEKVYWLLNFLERKFNGDVFALENIGQQKLTKGILSNFADLVEARTIKRQRYLWKQFSFKHLPVEIISHLYQRFVQGGHGAVYTPPFLASLLLDQALPYSKLTGTERILDPACGSGIFLVGAFKRLVNVWRSRNSWRRPSVTSLKKILKQSIYGIELDPNAIDLSVFSLCLAICDALQPKVIWQDLKFDPLYKSNLFKADFFQVLLNSHQKVPTLFDNDFDVIIGNPPFESKLSDSGKEVNYIAQQNDNSRGSLPDKQVAYLFFEQAFNVLKPGGRVCLIQPAQFLYNNNTFVFRAAIQKKYKIDTILDFTSIRKLYEADPKTIAVIAYTLEPKENHWINHWTFRRTMSVNERICFELDHYDRYRVTQNQAVNDAYVWRVNLFGGGRLLDISQSLRNMRTLSQYVKEQGWDYGEGFIEGNKEKLAPFLKGQKLLPTSAFTEAGINEDEIDVLATDRFEAPRTKERFTAPLILIKELKSLPVAFWDKGFIAYRNEIVGIHAPKAQKTKLQELFKTLQKYHDIYCLSCALNGSRLLVSKATAIFKKDIDIFPYPRDKKELFFSFWEDALSEDVLKYMIDYVRLGQNSELLKKMANKNHLIVYSNMFLRMLGSIYENLKASDPIFLNGLICQPFFFGGKPNIDWLDEKQENNLRNIIYDNKTHEHLRTIRLLRFYSENVLLIIKPDRLRYWISSTAIRDADETLVDLRRQGY
ncbi:N-6 DNA methylase [Desulfosudis oleivorans Hxd3]|uniref:site-specific DNA-methyltransferase (adenine-specific) n=2 Tax=Desulfosudis TaxID=2904716 RepID=A8ZZS2_DESOH|nr:N-6 DNA methylase [Desulfosudis oleivorans Hxd3]